MYIIKHNILLFPFRQYCILETKMSGLKSTQEQFPKVSVLNSSPQ